MRVQWRSAAAVIALGAVALATANGACVGNEPVVEPLCPPPLLMCGTDCTKPSIDPANCGACGIVCSAGQSCVGSVCVGPDASVATGDASVATSDASVTGSDASAASSEGGAQCAQGLRLCPEWQGYDAGADASGTADGSDASDAGAQGFLCIDPSTDDRNCGGCGVVCGADQSCVAAACSYAPSCRDLLLRKGPLEDGTYTVQPAFVLDGGRAIAPFPVYCDGMGTGAPQEYLSLAHSVLTNEPGSNYTRGGANPPTCPCVDLVRQFTRLRLDLSTMSVDVTDYTFSFADPDASACWESPECSHSTYNRVFGNAYDCVGAPDASAGSANIDFTDTPFSIDPAVVFGPWGYPPPHDGGGGLTVTGNASMNPARTVVNLVGGGFCGGWALTATAPGQSWPIPAAPLTLVPAAAPR